MRITGKAPCRVVGAGGTIDIWPLYLYHRQPVTVNFAINRFAACELATRSDGRINFTSLDQNLYESFEPEGGTVLPVQVASEGVKVSVIA